MPKLSKEEQAEIAKQRACPHPKEREQEMGLAIFCGVCGLRLRFLEEEDANQKIMDALKTMF